MSDEEYKKQRADWYGNPTVIEFCKLWKNGCNQLKVYVTNHAVPPRPEFFNKKVMSLLQTLRQIAYSIHLTGLDPEFYMSLTTGFDKFLHGWKCRCRGFEIQKTEVSTGLDRHFDSFVIRYHEQHPNDLSRFIEQLKSVGCNDLLL